MTLCFILTPLNSYRASQGEAEEALFDIMNVGSDEPTKVIRGFEMTLVVSTIPLNLVSNTATFPSTRKRAFTSSTYTSRKGGS